MKTQLNISSLLAVLFIALMINSTYGQGILVIQHLGANDPTSEGFTLNNNGSVGPIIGDLGMNAWVTETTNHGGPVFYQQTLTSQQQTALAGANWDLSVTLRVLQSPLAGDTSVQLDTGSMAYGLFFSVNASGDPVVGPYTLTGAGSTYNNYQLIYDASTEMASLLVNNVDEINNITGTAYTYPAQLTWGENQGGPFQANWNLVSLSITPEPSTASLIFLGSVVFIYVRRAFHR